MSVFIPSEKHFQEVANYLAAREATDAQKAAICQPLEIGLRRLRDEYARLTLKKAEIAAYSQNEITLF